MLYEGTKFETYRLIVHGACRCNKNELIALPVEFGNCFIKGL
jgi:hypothetical protein